MVELNNKQITLKLEKWVFTLDLPLVIHFHTCFLLSANDPRGNCVFSAKCHWEIVIL